jgi:hypothetical protein
MNSVVLHTVVSPASRKAIRGFLSAEKAEVQAERIGAEVGKLERRVGERVRVTFAGHPKQGEIVRFEGRRMVVRLATKAGGPLVEKSFELEF